ncbi:MAG: FKBP-type peptidyl-prolyl cis-trans isomerase [Candidatus Pelagadaptatus aseana]|uniref:FKBP-type peptidyl-prolyl cis-trans isomerase n=1 Tax=Candidatus Pelagadaptatus aseana TaxID=3120508 RepID=UPI0039B296A4
MSQTIGEGTQVTLHFAIKLENGDVVDSTFDKTPASFAVGDGSLLPGFEKALFGLQTGEKGAFVIKPEDGFGAINTNNRQEMPRSQFPEDIELVEGLMLSFADAQKAEMPGVVYGFDDETVTIDFNHPLAGRDIVFEVEIIDVAPAAQ